MEKRYVVLKERERWSEDARGLLQHGRYPAEWILDDQGEPRAFTEEEAKAFVAAGMQGATLRAQAGHPYDSYDPAPTFADVVWHYDPAASGPRRRAFVLSDAAPRKCFVLGAYEDGRWFVESHQNGDAGGRAADLEAAKQRAYEVWKAMV